MNHSLSTKVRALAALALCVVAPACSNMKTTSEGGSEPFRIAKSPEVPIERRIEAAKLLDEVQKERLSRELTSELPGHWDLATLSAIILLGEVGDAGAIARLEAIDEMNHESTGKFHLSIVDAIEQIRKRIGPAERQSNALFFKWKFYE